ncbi:sensor histidine kinase [Microbacterium horticulturae]|uniref:histidine kinase n=1 Tax=Microbacterium horticulturae TaxID=3028316 RepID=A0ABY8BYG8_9MICO|nr:sensor histidine kinase [Microbacterium sp. KACC 23027]WEG08537.1 sensor histidine kinase [Microbacterium sp. KACC 23027]
MRVETRLQRQDIALAAAIGIGTIISAALGMVAGIYGGQQAPMWAAVVYAVVLAAAIAVRRRRPGTVAVITATSYFAAVTWHVPELYAGNIAMFIGFYTVGAISSDRRRAFWVRAGITLGMFVWLLTVTFIESTHPADDSLSRAGAFSPFVAYALLNILVNALYFGGAYLFGERAWAAARQRRALEERTAELERERERTAAQAVALERVRIARELHDVVAHHVSLMGVQAGAARAVMDKDRDAASRTLGQVEGSARDALRELRQLLETLRSDGDADAPSTVGLAGLADLVAESASAGLPATLTVIGEPHPVPDTVQVSLYRIAQEALTNARRHAGRDATADLRLRYDDAGIEVEITNTGRRVTRVGRGLGLVGMRERALAVGGTVEARPRERGGFLVRATVPLVSGELVMTGDAGA